MPTYTIHVLNDAYAVQAVLANTSTYADFTKISYRLAVNDIDSCSIEIVPNSPKIAQCVGMNRVLVYRDGVLQFGGVILRESWDVGTDPKNDVYQIDALGGGIYLDWRLIVPSGGEATDTRTGAADDIAKDYVYYHCGYGASIGRDFSDLTVQADATACSSWTEEPSYEIVLDEVQKLQKLGLFDWRVVPSATGFEFQTAYPQWGLDRTWGNGTNADAVFSLDRRNYQKISYTKDSIGHYNYIYVGGATAVRERSTAGDITAYKRRERWESASSYEDNTAVDYIGDMRLKEMAVAEGMYAEPWPTTWKVPWDLGDLVTISADRYGRTFTDDAKITAVNVEVTADGVERVSPEMVGGV